MRLAIILVCMFALGCSAPSPSPAPRPDLIEPLAFDDGAVPLAGELRCAWSRGDDTLLLAAGDVDPSSRAAAVVRHAGETLRLQAAALGGFDALLRGASFRGPGSSATVTLGAREATGHEGLRHRSTLQLTIAGERRTLDGWWSCGP